jgi:putative transcriptional regulator
MNVYDSIVKGLNEAIDYEKGHGNARKAKCTVAPVPDFNAKQIKDVRGSLDMSQEMFAKVMGVSKKTVEAWEAGTNKPIGTARRMLSLIQSDSTLVTKYKIVIR